MADGSETERSKGATPPYIAFQTIKTILKDFKEHGMPGRIDRSVLTNFSGAVIGQVLPALKFLGLTNNDGEPTNWLVELKDAYGTDQWGGALEKVLRHAYGPLFTLNLQTATPSQFNERFKAAYPGTDDVQRKCMTFFLNAVRDTSVVVSPYIMKNKKPRNGTPKKRASRPQQERTASGGRGGDPTADAPPPPPAQQQMSPYDVLMKVIYNPTTMKPEEEQAVFTLIRYLRTQETQ